MDHITPPTHIWDFVPYKSWLTAEWLFYPQLNEGTWIIPSYHGLHQYEVWQESKLSPISGQGSTWWPTLAQDPKSEIHQKRCFENAAAERQQEYLTSYACLVIHGFFCRWQIINRQTMWEEYFATDNNLTFKSVFKDRFFLVETDRQTVECWKYQYNAGHF